MLHAIPAWGFFIALARGPRPGTVGQAKDRPPIRILPGRGQLLLMAGSSGRPIIG